MSTLNPQSGDNRWSYGDAGDRFPIQRGDIWQVGGHRFICADVVEDDVWLGGVVGFADMVYVDPPWNAGNARAFRTKAGLNDGPVDFGTLLRHVMRRAVRATRESHGDIYSEMGLANIQALQATLTTLDRPVLDVWPITYYRTKPAMLARSGRYPYVGAPMAGQDDEHTPRLAIEASTAPGDRVLDPCAGRGLTAASAARLGRLSTSIELNPRRLAVAMGRVSALVAIAPSPIITENA